MEKLERDILFKALCSYLPWKLKGVTQKKNTAWMQKGSIITMSIEYIGLFLEPSLYVKPILRPLSDLTKEIDLNENEYWIPIESIFHDWRKSLKLELSFTDGALNELWLEYPDAKGDYVQESSMTLKDWNTLFQHHFDVFGLIEKGLAIDINTI